MPLAVRVAAGLGSRPAAARTLLKNICRVKGQEENTLHGLGLVIGLKGTGDGGDFLPTIRSLATALQLMGTNPFGQTEQHRHQGRQERGAGHGDGHGAGRRCPARATRSTARSARSARPEPGRRHVVHDAAARPAGAARGPAREQSNAAAAGPTSRVYAFAQGLLHIETHAERGPVHKGCRLEEDFFNVFSKEDKITLVLDKNHADFQVAQDVAELINSQLNFQSHDGVLAKALNAVNIEVMIPQQYRDDPVLFISQVLSLPMIEPHAEARVVINERAGSVVIGGDVEIGSVVVTHKNVVVETGDNTGR